MDEQVVRVLVRLVQIHEQLGERCFEDAVHNALVAIARTAQLEAERITTPKGTTGAEIVPFPSRTAGPASTPNQPI